MCESFPWRKLKNIKSIIYIFLIISVTFYISFLISSRYNPKKDSQHIQRNCSNLYKLCYSNLCLSAFDGIRCLQTNLVVLKIEISTWISFYNNVKDFENKFSSILQEHQINNVQLNVIVFEPLNRPKSRFKETILKINEFVWCNFFLILTFFYINRVLREILLICDKALIKNHSQLLEKIYKSKKRNCRCMQNWRDWCWFLLFPQFFGHLRSE